MSGKDNDSPAKDAPAPLALEAEFLAILACPICKGKLDYQPEKRRFVCPAEKLAYPITEEGIPVLLAEEAKPLAENDG